MGKRDIIKIQAVEWIFKGGFMGYCRLSGANPLDRIYHDREWGIPLHDERKQFEFLTMEVMQCGLSWVLMLKKRDIFRKVFEDYDIEKIAAFTEEDVERIIHVEDMIASPRKVRAVIGNAKAYLEIQKESGSFSSWFWSFTDGKTVLYTHHNEGQIPVSNGLSEKISKELKKRGFKYLGPITLYSHLQACGIINDHDDDCPRYEYILKNFPCVRKRRQGEKK